MSLTELLYRFPRSVSVTLNREGTFDSLYFECRDTLNDLDGLRCGAVFLSDGFLPRVSPLPSGFLPLLPTDLDLGLQLVWTFRYKPQNFSILLDR